MSFGTISAGVLAILLVFYVIKTVIDIIVRGYTLHAIFGWSFRLLGAVWSSIAHCLIYSAQSSTPSDIESPDNKK